MKPINLRTLLTLWMFLAFVATEGRAEEQCANIIGKFHSVDGEVEIRSDSGNWEKVTTGGRLCDADTIRVGKRSRAAVRLVNNTVLRLDQNTTLRLANVSGNSEEWAMLEHSRGFFYAFSRAPWHVKINTPFLKGLIDGTEFYVAADDNSSQLAVLEGHIRVENERGKTTIGPGMKALAEAGAAPSVHTLVHPRDAVQWALYYPPILSAEDYESNASAVLKKAMVLSLRKDLVNAYAAFEQIPNDQRNTDFYLYRAALSLSVGRTDDAHDDIAQALQLNSGEGLAYALRSIIEIARNHREAALTDARQAVKLSPSAAARIALSYALQASRKLPEAKMELQTAASQHPDNALVWARLSELELMLDNRGEARRAADKAMKLSPDLQRAQLVSGFCALSEFDNDEARSAFENAIRLDSAEPLAHFGLGLAKISAGDVVEGRGEIEIAVSLDGNNSLLRSYLGKAYFTEKRSPLDATQLEIAKSLDPHDPTPYLYDGIRKQSENHPVEALHDLQKSKDLNDNRAVYRSRELLDQDRASRGISIARTYKDLGFNTLGQREASISLEDDPANPSAHRFLSDSYLGVRRREISRVSELLQAQMLQDINVTPIQPSLAETNLNMYTLGGPANPGFNEFTPLFERNTAKFDSAFYGGSNDTFGGEGAVTAVYDRFSFGAGGMHYQTDGWRLNNGLNQHLYDFFAQAAVTPDLNIQAEYRHRESTEGDLAFRFDPDDIQRDKTVEREQDTIRGGIRYKASRHSTLLFSYIHSEREQSEDVGSIIIDPLTTLSSEQQLDSNGDQFEGQYIYQRNRFNMIAGYTHNHSDRELNGRVTFFNDFFPAPFVIQTASSDSIQHDRGYMYSRITYPLPVTWTLGFSYDDYRQNLFEISGFNPKFGVQWDVTSNLRLRGAWFRTLKPSLVNNRTIEPTQIAGFNQFFDDPDATRYWRYGGGFDWRLWQDLYFGGEISWRKLDEAVVLVNLDGSLSSLFEDRDEELHSLYLYWTPTEHIGVRGEFAYDLYRSEKGIATTSGTVPESIETFSVPLSVAYFDPSGWFASVGGTFVNQNVHRSETAQQASGSDNFFLVDTHLGYRFPRRMGQISIGVKNLFDKQFHYQDDSFREFRDEPATGPYFPDRIIMGRLVFNF